jgi:hypothetical protein
MQLPAQPCFGLFLVYFFFSTHLTNALHNFHITPNLRYLWLDVWYTKPKRGRVQHGMHALVPCGDVLDETEDLYMRTWRRHPESCPQA